MQHHERNKTRLSKIIKPSCVMSWMILDSIQYAIDREMENPRLFSDKKHISISDQFETAHKKIGFIRKMKKKMLRNNFWASQERGFSGRKRGRDWVREREKKGKPKQQKTVWRHFFSRTTLSLSLSSLIRMVVEPNRSSKLLMRIKPRAFSSDNLLHKTFFFILYKQEDFWNP